MAQIFSLVMDLADGLVSLPLVISESPVSYNTTHDIEKEQPVLFPSCAITRVQSRHSGIPSADSTPSPKFCNTSDLSKQVLEKAQKNDATFIPLRCQAIDEDDILHPPSFYYQIKILMRFYRPSKMSNGDSWAECHQIDLREPVLQVAHEGFAGHLGNLIGLI